MKHVHIIQNHYNYVKNVHCRPTLSKKNQNLVYLFTGNYGVVIVLDRDMCKYFYDYIEYINSWNIRQPIIIKHKHKIIYNYI